MRYQVAILGCLVFAGCESVRAVRVGGMFVPSRPIGCAVEVHTQEPASAHDLVCQIQAPAPYENSIDKIKERACECGADAIVIPVAQFGSPSRISGIRYRNRAAE